MRVGKSVRMRREDFYPMPVLERLNPRLKEPGKKSGSQLRYRTQGLLITCQALYQLSYWDPHLVFGPDGLLNQVASPESASIAAAPQYLHLAGLLRRLVGISLQ